MNKPIRTAQEERLRQVRLYAEIDEQAGGMSMPETAGMVHNITASMWEKWNRYWNNYDPKDRSAAPLSNGGFLSRVGPDQATYSREGVRPFTIRRSTNMNLIANLDETVADVWAREDGFEPIWF